MKTNWLRARREELHLSQEELSARLQVAGLNISRATVSHWETERYNIPLDNPELRHVLANILRMNIADMLLAAGYEISEGKRSPAARRAADIVDHLPPDAQGLALDYLQVLEKRFIQDQ